MASITRSIPLPGPTRPQVDSIGCRAASRAAAACGMAAPWGMVSTLAGSTSKPSAQPVPGRAGHDDDTIGEPGHVHEDRRWCGVGSQRTVCAITMEGIRRDPRISSTSSPSSPP